MAAPTPTPAPPTLPTPPPSGGACAAKNGGLTAWCMDWAVHTDTPPAGAASHWLTRCSTVGVPLRAACEAASLTLTSPAPDNTASVLLDGPPDASGNAALVACGLFIDKVKAEPAQAAAWTAKHDQCVQLTPQYVAALFVPAPASTPDDDACDALDVACKVAAGVREALAAGVGAGIQGFVDLVVQGMVVMLSWLAKLVFTTTSIAAADDAFYTVYNSLAGVLILLVFIFFLISTIINGLRVNGPGPLSSIGGLIRAILGISFAGGIAFIIVQAWDTATNALIEHNARTPYDPSRWVKGITALSGGAGTGFVALCIAFMSIIGLILLFIMMLFRGLLTTGAALFGAMAMTGQVMPETRHWGRRWFWTVNALASSKFFIAALWIYGSRSAYESDLFTSLKALLLIWVMVLTPGILLRLTTMWDGYLSDVNARAVLSATGTAGDIGAGFGDGLTRGLSAGGGGPGDEAAGQMNAISADIATTPGQMAGLEDGPVSEAAEAIETSDDGGQVGDVSELGVTSEHTSGGVAEKGDNDRPNADEAEAVQVGTNNARHDAATGELTVPGDATGADALSPGASPASDSPRDAKSTGGAAPGEAAGDAAPGTGSADPGGVAGAGGAAGTTAGEGVDSPSASGSAAGPQESGEGTPVAQEPATTALVSGSDPDRGTDDDTSARGPRGGGEPGPTGAGGGAGGGSGGAASGAADAAIVAL
ncbi:hypothetical protein GCM10010166_62570 [Couchioplanes caeruleus subsp. azureus]|nr:hypothetical protein GCM10010166_62570 [Couchioplanes caeruleus subsp. azureus]